MNSRRFTVSHAPRNPPTKNLAQSSSKQLPRTQPVNAMSALPPKADMVQRDHDVRFGQKRAWTYSINSLASCWSCPGTSSPSAFAVLRLITSSNLMGA
jgi:hypothetical protein